MGNCYISEGRLDEALAAYQKAIEIDQHAANAWVGLGNIYKLQGDNEKASMAFRTALELDPKNAPAWNELGDFHYSTGAHDEAMQSYQKGIEFNQGNKLSYSNMASISIQNGRYAEAIPLLQKAIEFSNDLKETAHLWNLLGDTYRRLDNYNEALSAYRKADTLASENALPQSKAPTIKPDPVVNPVDQIPAQPAELLEHDSPEGEAELPEKPQLEQRAVIRIGGMGLPLQFRPWRSLK